MTYKQLPYQYLSCNRRKAIRWFVAAGLLAWLPAGCAWTPLQPVAATVESSSADTRVTIVRAGERTVIEVRSPRGIGRSRITFAEPPPGALEFRLHVAGLEHFEVVAGESAAALSLPQGQTAPLITLRTAEATDTPVAPGSPYWMTVERPAPGATDPVFRVVAPRRLIGEQSLTVELNWIDFYR